MFTFLYIFSKPALKFNSRKSNNTFSWVSVSLLMSRYKRRDVTLLRIVVDSREEFEISLGRCVMNKANKFCGEEQKNNFSEELQRKLADCVPLNIYALAKGQFLSESDSTKPASAANAIFRATINLGD